MGENLTSPELVQQPMYGYVVSLACALARGPCHLRGSGKIVRAAKIPGNFVSGGRAPPVHGYVISNQKHRSDPFRRARSKVFQNLRALLYTQRAITAAEEADER